MTREFVTALQFLTRIRLFRDPDYDDGLFGRSVKFFPLVGLLAGSILAGVAVLTGGWLPGTVRSTLLVTLSVFITGGLHCDGLMDSADGLFSGRSRERMLEIMKDSRLGTHGALGLIFTLLLKALAVGQLLDGPHPAWGALVAAPVVGRSLMALLMYHQRYARSNGLGNLYIGKISGRQLGITLGGGLLLAVLLCGGAGLWGWLGCLLFAWGYRQALYRTLGGQTGDTLGGGNELFELCFLLLLC